MKFDIPKKYRFIKYVNSGYHGNIYLVMLGKQYRVLKEIIDIKGGLNELLALIKLNHNNIIKLNTFSIHNDKLYFEFKYYGNGSLLERIRKSLIPIDDVNKWKHQLKGVIEYCHNINITHNDLKLNNILLDKNHNIILIDFGCSSEYGDCMSDINNMNKIFNILDENKILSKL